MTKCLRFGEFQTRHLFINLGQQIELLVLLHSCSMEGIAIHPPLHVPLARKKCRPFLQTRLVREGSVFGTHRITSEVQTFIR